MTILRSIIATVLFILFIEIIAVWLLLDLLVDIEFLVDRFYRFINGTIELLCVVAFLSRVNGVKTFKPKPAKSFYYLLAIVIGLSFPFLQTVLNFLYNSVIGTEISITYKFDLAGINPWNFLATVFFVPIAEELFFRQYIQKGIGKNYNHILGVILSAVLFASIHLNYTALFLNGVEFQPHGAYIALFGGLISGALYLKSKSIIPSIIFHMSWNLMVTIC